MKKYYFPAILGCLTFLPLGAEAVTIQNGHPHYTIVGVEALAKNFGSQDQHVNIPPKTSSATPALDVPFKDFFQTVQEKLPTNGQTNVRLMVVAELTEGDAIAWCKNDNMIISKTSTAEDLDKLDQATASVGENFECTLTPKS